MDFSRAVALTVILFYFPFPICIEKQLVVGLAIVSQVSIFGSSDEKQKRFYRSQFPP